jgi:hypothetical protein
MKPTVGRIVLYTLTRADADAINRRRRDYAAHAEALGTPGWQAHVGNKVYVGATFPMVVVRVFTRGTGAALVNGQVLLDGNDTLWATSRIEGDGVGEWYWPKREES